MRKFALSMFLILACILFSGSIFVAMADSAPDIQPLPGQVNPYKTRSELLMNASDYVGVTSPEDAATVWAKGLEGRSAAMQYIVMTDKLKNDYAKQLDDLQSNWVTGQSSPSIQGYSIEKIISPDNIHAKVELKFLEGYDYKSRCNSYQATLWLVREKDFWRIERIWTDKELYGYTWYDPQKYQ